MFIDWIINNIWSLLTIVMIWKYYIRNKNTTSPFSMTSKYVVKVTISPLILHVLFNNLFHTFLFSKQFFKDVWEYSWPFWPIEDQNKVQHSKYPSIHRKLFRADVADHLKAIRYYSNLTYNIILFFIYTIVRMVISLINKPS